MASPNLPPADAGDGANRAPHTGSDIRHHPAGPVVGADEALAPAAIEAFLHELRLGEADVKHEREPDADIDGRFGFRLSRGEQSCLVLVPGLPVERIRYTRAPGQDVWSYPRFDVDGVTWHWANALKKVREALR